jgi:hypothetical protein
MGKKNGEADARVQRCKVDVEVDADVLLHFLRACLFLRAEVAWDAEGFALG